MIEDTFSKEEYARYSRHFILPEINVEGQKKMKNAKVLVIGAGGLGSPVLLYLAAAGIGTIGIVDFDLIDKGNLQRQIIYTTNDVGKPKAVVAKERILALNPHITVNLHQVRLDSSNALDIISQYDVVVDGTDNFPTRYLVNDACVLAGKPDVFGSIFRFEGQVAVFNYFDEVSQSFTANYRDIFPEPPAPGEVPNCAEGGVLGVLPGIIGSMQTNEVIKIVCGIGDVLAGKLLLLDTLSFLTRTIKIRKSDDNPISGLNPTITELIDYEEFCGIATAQIQQKEEVKEIDVFTLDELLKDSEKTVQVIDVREPYEYEISNIGGELIPLSKIDTAIDRISNADYVVVHCRTGVRSTKAIKKLLQTSSYDNLYNLKGGILSWIDEIDNSLPRY
ncbi:molybdopterin-synthase adenylyltransferase MoeB [Chondrinema litorale]|uniref:molybdopterin-synthase adenylyltransferase MoeB n=1 Tax=Chondrinema litorale TaxID=2994555 RepID=UPI0025438F78|nr:molybdopterin-synthase adenylyltransferase MoeB [Chondrinema litorale]UZR92990.1 molybdopterin-synthase adenylyltransferase MoeB [Chondrinema litorale]